MAKLLNQGAYGCVYYPGFTCKGNTEKSKRYVTKIEIHDKTSKNELDISKTVKTIKNYNKFFSPVVKHCISRFKQVDKYRDKLEDCEPINIEENIYNDFIIIYINYIKGKELEKHILNIESPVIATLSIISSYTYLLNSIKRLQEKNIIHYDLHTGNILFDLNKKIPIIIDFGLSIDTKLIFSNHESRTRSSIDYLQLKKSIMHYSPKHYTYPPELHFITYLLNDIDVLTDNIDSRLKEKVSKTSIDTFVEDMIEANKIHRRYQYYKTSSTSSSSSTTSTTTTTNEYRREIESYYNQFINTTKKQAIDTLVEYIKYLDVYTLTIDMSVIIIKILDRLTTESESSYKKVLFLILEFLIYNLRIDPEKRLTIDELVNIYRIVFTEKTATSKKIISKIQRLKSDSKSLADKFLELEKYYITPNLKILDDRKIQQLIS